MFWRTLPSPDWQLQMTIVSRLGVRVRFRVFRFWGVFNSRVPSCPVQRWFPRHKHTCPSCFDIAERFRLSSCKFWSWHRFPCPKFPSFSFWWASCRPITLAFRASIFKLCSTGFSWRKCSSRFPPCWPSGWLFSPLQGKLWLWIRLSFAPRKPQWTSSQSDSHFRTSNCSASTCSSSGSKRTPRSSQLFWISFRPYCTGTPFTFQWISNAALQSRWTGLLDWWGMGLQPCT